MYTAHVTVMLKETILDPQGKAVLHAVNSLGYTAVSAVRVGKKIVLDLNESDKAKAERAVADICAKLLTNPVIEDYSYELELRTS